jgi:ferritin-like metal-binding protein YciE
MVQKKKAIKSAAAKESKATIFHNAGMSKNNNSKNNNSKGDSFLEKFFTDQLKDIYYAENKILEGLKKMEESSTTDELKDAFREHHTQTEKHVKRLEKVFGLIGKNAEGEKCEAIEGILKEADSIIEETREGSMTRDAALIFAAQKVEHYEIATYGGLVQFAITMGHHEAADILDRTLREEENADAFLTEIAENDINLGAEHEGIEFSEKPSRQEAKSVLSGS